MIESEKVDVEDYLRLRWKKLLTGEVTPWMRKTGSHFHPDRPCRFGMEGPDQLAGQPLVHDWHVPGWGRVRLAQGVRDGRALGSLVQL